MKNNKGFIAISLIYSFFLVFLMTLLVIITSYAHNRVLLNDVKEETQKYLNSLTEFNPIVLEKRTYTRNEEIVYGTETWVVLENTSTDVKMILKRRLTATEIALALNNGIPANAKNNDTILMCLKTHVHSYGSAICYYENSTSFNYYYWDQSLARIVIDYFIENNATIKKAIALNALQMMVFSDGFNNQNSFVRIPLSSEYSLINDPNIWYMTSTRTNGMSYININGANVLAHNSYKGIRPVITVKKSI